MRNLARVVILGAASIVLFGCDTLTAEQSMWLRDGQRAYDRRHFSEAVRLTSLFLERAADRPETGRALYLRGLSQARSGRRPQAYSDLKSAAGRTDDVEVAWRAQFALGELSFEDARWAEAERHYSAAAAKMRPISPMDRALYRLGVAQQRVGAWDESLRSFEQLARRFPRRALGAAARRILQIRPRYFSLQCGAFALEANAETLRLQLTRKGLSAFVRREQRNQRSLHIVYAGRYPTYADAKRGLARNREHVSDAVIWP